jgi:hypothetical protein
MFLIQILILNASFEFNQLEELRRSDQILFPNSDVSDFSDPISNPSSSKVLKQLLFRNNIKVRT